MLVATQYGDIMAILIPSKNIYSKDENISENNAIKQVKVGVSKVNEIITENDSFYTFLKDSTDLYIRSQPWSIKYDYRFTSSSVGYAFNYIAAIVGIRYVTTSAQIAVPKVLDSKKVLQLSKLSNFSWSIKYKKSVGSSSVRVSMNSASLSVDDVANVYTNYEDGSAEDLPNSEKLELDFDWIGNDSVTLNAETVLGVGNAIRPLAEDSDNWYFNVNFLAGIEKFSISSQGMASQLGSNYTAQIDGGTAEIYEPISVELTFAGKTVSISLEDNSLVYGDNAPFFNIERNEILQDSLTTFGVPTSQYNATEILAHFFNGKSTLTNVSCGLGEYYDEYGHLAVSTKKTRIAVDPSKIVYERVSGLGYIFTVPQPFERNLHIEIEEIYQGYVSTNTLILQKHQKKVIYNPEGSTIRRILQAYYDVPFALQMDDEVIPYRRDEFGSDLPLFLNANNTPKKFKVCSVQTVYDGATVQKLNLLEASNITDTLIYNFSTQEQFYVLDTLGENADGANIVIPNYYKGFAVGAISLEVTNPISINSITIPTNVKYIDSAWDEINIKETHIESIESWCDISLKQSQMATPIESSHNFFVNGEKVVNLYIPDEVRTIKHGVFYSAKNLLSVNTNKVEFIAEDAFGNCPNIEYVILGKNLKEVLDSAFSTSYPQKYFNVYYEGTADEYKKINIVENYALDYRDPLSQIFYYSESQPLISGKYWHYDQNGNPKIW